jgi:hypothetical protein
METAVEWLVEQITKHTWYDEEGFGHVSVSILDINKAKEREKLQIEIAFLSGKHDGIKSCRYLADYKETEAEQYYNEKFKKCNKN